MKTLEDGDLFERGYRPWIIENLPFYEVTWRRFVGNDGAGHPKPEIKIPNELAGDWRKFYQSHYSMAVFAFLLDRQTKVGLDYLAENGEKGLINTPAALARNVELFSQFVGMVGQICDMVRQIGEALKNQTMVDLVVDFAAERNNSIHSASIPMSYDGVGIRMPSIAVKRGEEGKWFEDQRWDFIARDKLQYLEEWYSETRNGLLGKLKKPIGEMIYSAAEKRFQGEPPSGENRIKIPILPPPRAPLRDPTAPEWGNIPGSGDAAIRRPHQFPESSVD